MIAASRLHSPAEFKYTLRRLAEAEDAIDRGQVTAAVMLIRCALESASKEAFGFPLDTKTFLTIVAVQAGASRRLVSRLRNLRGTANGVAHAASEGRIDDAREMLRFFRLIGCRWLRRFHGVAVTDVIAAPEEPVGV